MSNQFEKYNAIPREKFKFSNQTASHDLKFDTKPVGYMRDAWNRFKKNKASIVAFIIIVLLLLFAVVVPFFTQYTVSYNDSRYVHTLPRNKLFVALGWDFWDGCADKTLNKQDFLRLQGIYVESGVSIFKNNKYSKTLSVVDGEIVETYHVRLDVYRETGVILVSIPRETYESIQQYQDETDRQVIYPITVKASRPIAEKDNDDGNYWFKTESAGGGRTRAVLDENGNFIPIYVKYNGFDNYTSKMRIEGDVPLYNYGIVNETGYEVRLNYYEYYIYLHSYVLQDGITEPYFLFGTTVSGQDILTCLASGARFSFLIALIVASINLTIGTIYGAIEGYYGGATDLIMERISDILVAVPMMVVITLLNLHMKSSSQLMILFIAFFLTGWIGMAGRVRMQFYRFKNQEYIFAARTLGARDRRIMFKHILPNSLGTLITGSVLVIPGVIFSESQLSYLGIINLNSGSMTSVGSLLANAQPFLSTYPHEILFPSVFISLLMLSFNLFGNGLRDAFNSLLRGVDG